MKELKCHCGEFLANIEIDDFDKVLRCNCSLCKRRGAIMSMVKNENFKMPLRSNRGSHKYKRF